MTLRHVVAAFRVLALALATASSAWADQSAAIAAECKLAETAHLATTKALGAAPNSILVGCPGHEALRDDSTRKLDRQRFSAAARTEVPAATAQGGRSAKIIFQRMIARGVPPEIAVTMTETTAFSAAVAAASKP